MTTFDFLKPTEQYMNEIHPGIIMYITSISHSVAHLYFRDDKGNKIPPPREFSIFSFDFQNLKKIVVVEPERSTNYYLLCWSEKYELEWNGEIKLTLKSQRQWDIITG